MRVYTANSYDCLMYWYSIYQVCFIQPLVMP